jgi:hypothetical protein
LREQIAMWIKMAVVVMDTAMNLAISVAPDARPILQDEKLTRAGEKHPRRLASRADLIYGLGRQVTE